MHRIKKKIHQILEVSDPGDEFGKIFDIILITLILLNALALILETIQPVADVMGDFFFWFEFYSVLFFSIEYVLRVWVITIEPKFSHPVIGRLRYMVTAIALIDLLAILPFFMPMLNIDLRFLRLFRLFRIFRLLKIVRYFKALNLMLRVFQNKKEELVMILTFILFMLVLSASLMYYIEKEVQPEAFASIPDAMWWGVATLTTVGYGDVYPVTALGQLLGAFIALLGIGFFALPTGILASGFSEEIRKKKNESSSCPHCGKELPD